MPVFATRPSGLPDFYSHGHGDEGDIPGGIGDDTSFIQPGMVSSFFAESNALSCGDWATMTTASRIAAITRWLQARGVWIFDVEANLGVVDAECARIAAANSAKTDREKNSRTAAAETALAAERERARVAALVAAAYNRTPEGRASILLGQLGMTCTTWSASKDSNPTARTRIIQLSLGLNETDAASIREELDRFCSGNQPTVNKPIVKADILHPFMLAPNPTAGLPAETAGIYFAGGIAIGALVAFLW